MPFDGFWIKIIENYLPNDESIRSHNIDGQLSVLLCNKEQTQNKYLEWILAAQFFHSFII